MRDTAREAAARKARDRANRSTRRMVGEIVEVSGSQAKVSVDGRTIPSVIPASVAGVVVGATVRVQDGPTPVVESVLGVVSGAGWTYLPGGALLCWAKVSITPTAGSSTPVTWTFPRAFSAAPTLTGIAEATGTTVREVTISSPTATNVVVRLHSSTTDTTTVHVWAIGN